MQNHFYDSIEPLGNRSKRNCLMKKISSKKSRNIVVLEQFKEEMRTVKVTENYGWQFLKNIPSFSCHCPFGS